MCLNLCITRYYPNTHLELFFDFLEIDSEVDNDDKDIDLASIQRRKQRRKLRRLRRKRLALEHRNASLSSKSSPSKSPTKSPIKQSTTDIPSVIQLASNTENDIKTDDKPEPVQLVINAPTTSAALETTSKTDECTDSFKGTLVFYEFICLSSKMSHMLDL